MTTEMNSQSRAGVSEPASPLSISGGPLLAYATRLTPGADLVSSIDAFASRAMAAAGASLASSCFVISAVGSLEQVRLRMANANASKSVNPIQEWNERLEIISLQGTLSATGKHLHISVSNEHGNVFGGHVVSGIIYTTLELVVGVIPSVTFLRETDPATGYRELVVVDAPSLSTDTTLEEDQNKTQ